MNLCHTVLHWNNTCYIYDTCYHMSSWRRSCWVTVLCDQEAWRVILQSTVRRLEHTLHPTRSCSERLLSSSAVCHQWRHSSHDQHDWGTLHHSTTPGAGNLRPTGHIRPAKGFRRARHVCTSEHVIRPAVAGPAVTVSCYSARPQMYHWWLTSVSLKRAA